MTIFVSVAAYRDPQLVPTVQDCLAKADRPDEIRVVVCWQHHGDEDVSAIAADPRVQLIDRDARDSRGACWARAQIMAEYAGEDWFFQVDSHTRFAAGWDSRLIELAARTGAAKPLITCYPPTYDPTGDQPPGDVPAELVIEGWSDAGLPIMGQRTIEDWENQDGTVPARFLGACFLFAPGSFAREVRYDPAIYFQGEEILLAARAYTAGYDLFHPAEVLAWHYYLRQDSPRHWDDHGADGTDASWYELDRASHRRVLTKLYFPEVGHLAMGRHRTLAAYQEYAGVDFVARKWTRPATVTGDRTPPAAAATPH
ncbi:GlcNAc-transferase family protein [Actinoplanes awajinensis]|uniref:N-acetylglucosaminyltransferase n=1 Tax=Actinoplanes awajinensis subsp. mycoplanecinus TaxID=135947 RepID=A0A101JG88_9ACTN|nr:GlcNAc-transferase family protein [Actinoplanes awajinensis]KUL26278.1 N-acetylglucosaminyltransferase [Actinoplanes awajinensis subsp. mycoplanecinus]